MVAFDDDWLADDEGNLRLEVARALRRADAPDGAVVGIPLHVPPVGTLVRLGMIALGMIAVATLIAIATGDEEEVRTVHPVPVAVRQPREVARARPAAPVRRVAEPTVRVGAIFGTHVRLRGGPGLNHPIVSTLDHRQQLDLHRELRGWWEVATGNGLHGWVFGAYVRARDGTTDRGAAVITRRVDLTSPKRRLLPGQKVFVDGHVDGRATLLLFPDGRSARVASDAVDLVH